MAKKITIIGSGTWGMALANLALDAGCSVRVWSHSTQEIEYIKENHSIPNLKGLFISDEIAFYSNIGEAVKDADYVLVAVASQYLRTTVTSMKGLIREDAIVITATKGIEESTLMTMSDIISEVLGIGENRVVALSGPSHAEEVALRMPTCIVSSCVDERVAKDVQALLSTPYMRIYTNVDIKGVELCGAIKNVLAMACGISSGLGYGDNAKAAIITRGIAELSRLGRACGCLEDTFSGLTGIGDLIVTATSVHSRNNKFGRLLGEGYTVEDALKEVGMVVEGVHAIKPALLLAKKYGVEMPLVDAVYKAVFEHQNCKEVVRGLFERESKSE